VYENATVATNIVPDRSAILLWRCACCVWPLLWLFQHRYGYIVLNTECEAPPIRAICLFFWFDTQSIFQQSKRSFLQERLESLPNLVQTGMKLKEMIDLSQAMLVNSKALHDVEDVLRNAEANLEQGAMALRVGLCNYLGTLSQTSYKHFLLKQGITEYP
jgi:hypothetical protein